MKVGILGGSGYVGGELLRLLVQHRHVEIVAVTSNRYAGELIHRVHPNLRGFINLKFQKPDFSAALSDCDFLFISTPHGVSSKILPNIFETGVRIIDTSADFRLKDPENYPKWYKWRHESPEFLKKSVYGLPELHRETIRKASLVACPGCMAITSILALAPIVQMGKISLEKIIIDLKVGSSGGGAKPSLSSHHSEHYSTVRPYKPVGHRHTIEIEQELNALTGTEVKVAMSAHAVNMVRGILATCHLFEEQELRSIDLWRKYREFYANEPFIRLIHDRKGLFRYPDPKIVVGTNYCDIGFEIDNHAKRIVVLSATDNLIKGAAGTAVQNLNIMSGLSETEGLLAIGLHPV